MQTSSIASHRSSSSMHRRAASIPRGFQRISVRAPCRRISGHACMRTAAREPCSFGWNISHESRVPPSQRNTVCAAGGGGSLAEAMLESRGKGIELESLQLESDLRGKVSAAVEDLGCRVTVGDVAARAGVKTSDAEMALQALAADSQGTLEVSNEGDIVYALPLDFQATIRARSWWLRAQPTVAKLVAAGEYLVRVTFGTALITSVLLVWVTIMAILTSQSSSSDDRRRSNNSGFGGGGRGMGVWFNPVDVLWYWDPFYFQRRRERRASGEGMTFVESIFSFVFGDGDPNEDFEEMRWRTVGRYIQARGGVVTAEELAPYLDPPVFGTGIAARAEGISIDRSPLDESFVVPVLVRFNGHPEVDEGGNLLYTFPQLQTTSSMRASAVPMEKLALKAEWQMSGASEGQRLGTIALGVANVVGVLVLSNLLLDPQVVYALSRSSLAFVGNAMPLLQAYAVSFFAIPLARYLAYQRRNASIEAENDARRDALARLRMPEPGLVAKLESASQRAQRRVIQDEDLVYRSDRNLTDQKQAGTAGGVDWEAEDFERRLGKRS